MMLDPNIVKIEKITDQFLSRQFVRITDKDDKILIETEDPDYLKKVWDLVENTDKVYAVVQLTVNDINILEKLDNETF